MFQATGGYEHHHRRTKREWEKPVALLQNSIPLLKTQFWLHYNLDVEVSFKETDAKDKANDLAFLAPR